MLSATPKAVLFDWDGTLVNSWPIIHESMNQTLKAMGHAEWTIEETNERVRDLCVRLFLRFLETDGKRLAIFYAAYRAVHLERIAKKEGAEELIRCCLVSEYVLELLAINLVGICALSQRYLAGIGISKDVLLGPDAVATNPLQTRYTWR